MNRLSSATTTAFCVLAVACGAHSDHPSTSPSTSSLDRFVEILKGGHSLYGLGRGCDEWRAQPGDTDIELEVDVDDGEPSSEDQQRPDDHALVGRLTAQPDSEGRIYSFTYRVDPEKTPRRMRVTGRGGWKPAPGVVISRPDNPTMAIIGVGNYCIVDLDVRTDPHVQDAVFVGDEAWYLTRDACVRSKRNVKDAGNDRRGCAANGTPRAPRSGPGSRSR